MEANLFAILYTDIVVTIYKGDAINTVVARGRILSGNTTTKVIILIRYLYPF